MRLLSAEGVRRAVADPVPNALRNNEAQTNPPLPMGDTAFVAGGFDAFNRRTAPPGTPDFPELHPSIDRRELPPEWRDRLNATEESPCSQSVDNGTRFARKPSESAREMIRGYWSNKSG